MGKNAKKNFETSRRESLEKMLQGFILTFCGWGIKSASDELKSTADGWIHKTAIEATGPRSDVKKIFADLFLGTREKVYLVPAQHNPNVSLNHSDPKDVFTRTTYEAARSFAKVLDQVKDPMKRVDQLEAVKSEGNLITFGSPTSNIIVRTVMQYEAIGDGTEGFNHIKSDAMPLKFLYELDGQIIRQQESAHKECVRTVNGKTSSIPNWGIRRDGKSPLLPEISGGKLAQDYLLISNMPNFLNRNSLEQGHRIINFGGTHREGTEAIKHFFTNESLLNDLYDKVKKHQGKKSEAPYWQALLLVNCDLDEKSVSLESIMGVEPIEVHMKKLRELADKIQKDMK